jgi:hypothetical protein
MNANEARDHVAGQWTGWKVLDYSNLVDLQREYGVYVIRAKCKTPYLKGDSDILYVGEGILGNRLGQISEIINRKCYSGLLGAKSALKNNQTFCYRKAHFKLNLLKQPDKGITRQRSFVRRIHEGKHHSEGSLLTPS